MLSGNSGTVIPVVRNGGAMGQLSLGEKEFRGLKED